MAKVGPRTKVSRRKFLTGVAVAGAATTVTPRDVAHSQDIAHSQDLAKPAPAPDAASVPSALRPSAVVAAAETGSPSELAAAAGKPGSDYMVDVIKSLNIDYVFANPASSFRGLHESLLTYGGNAKPELIECMHEESSVAMAHGYFKATGKPIVTLCHGTVGLQHGCMAVYNAWCDRVPIIVLGGNSLDATTRLPGVPTYHSAVDIGALVRDFTKYDDNPVSLNHFGQSFVRAYQMALTPPYEPVFLSIDSDLQEHAAHEPERLTIPKYTPTAPPQGDANAVREAARLLADAQNPVIVADRCARTPAGVDLLVQLAESLNAPVIDQGSRMNFPNTHYLSQNARAGGLIAQADVIIGLELGDFWNTVNQLVDNGDQLSETRVRAGTKLISISTLELSMKSNYQDMQRYQSVDIAIAADAEATLPALIEAVKSAIPDERRDAIAKRGEALTKAFADARQRALVDATYAWDATPISTARLSAELWPLIKGEDWSLVSSARSVSNWPNRLWAMEKYHHHLGNSGGFGIGYGAPAAVGAALANKAEGRVSINIQCDGDLMYAPGVLWTAVHHRIPLLSVMHNNRAYHQEVMHVQRMANRRDRVLNDGPVGTLIGHPFIDYAKLAQSMGMYAIGPINDPKDLGPALKRALQVVKSGEPALVDVVTQPR
jgi:thiamine pyrophosphate-dependent acetolactate synthase large subunit-like protein